MQCFAGKHAVVTGGGSGIGRELVLELAARGCSAVTCDWNTDAVGDAVAAARASAPHGVLGGHVCDVSDETQVRRFCDELLQQQAANHVHLVFSNAGIGGGASFVTSSSEEWERTVAVDWWGGVCYLRPNVPVPRLSLLRGCATVGNPNRGSCGDRSSINPIVRGASSLAIVWPLHSRAG
jgi:NAD(P)-dependent dehydrogenase (short-subunit alcohol dehydrogenase family)